MKSIQKSFCKIYRCALECTGRMENLDGKWMHDRWMIDAIYKIDGFYFSPKPMASKPK
jgi:hypothetical protein